MTSFSIELQSALRHAAAAAQIAAAFGYEMPAEWHTATATAAAAKSVADELEPTLPAELPTADKLPAFITKTAAERDKWRTRVAVAAECHDRANRTAARVAIEQAPHVANRLTADTNDKVFPRLAELLDTAPHTIGGYESPDDMAAHAELLRVIAEASRAVDARAQLAIITGEGADIGRSAAMLIIDPGPDATVRAVDDAIAAVANDGIPTTIEAWQRLRRLNLSLAFPGEASARLAAYQAVRANQMRTPDGGMLDHTLGELAAIASQAGSPVRGYVGPTGSIIKTPKTMIEQGA